MSLLLRKGAHLLFAGGDWPRHGRRQQPQGSKADLARTAVAAAGRWIGRPSDIDYSQDDVVHGVTVSVSAAGPLAQTAPTLLFPDAITAAHISTGGRK